MRLLRIVFLLSVLLGTFPNLALSEETYRFERMWPTLQQPWYFTTPRDIAMDAAGYVYVADNNGYGVAKFSSDGRFINSWGGTDSNAGPIHPVGIAIDVHGDVYFSEDSNQVRKLSSDGSLIVKWGSFGSADGEFNSPKGIAVSQNGNVYVTDCGNQRIQKFSAVGTFMTKWGSEGNGDGQFRFDTQELSSFTEQGAIAVDTSGNVYVADTLNHRVQKFTPDGQFITKWGKEGIGDGEFFRLSGIEVGEDGNVYVMDAWNKKVSVFSPQGEFLYTFPCGRR